MQRKATAFTLIEMLVVVAILFLLALLLLPVLNRAREQARITECMSNLGQQGKAMLGHAGEHGQRLPIAGDHSGRTPGKYNGADRGLVDTLARFSMGNILPYPGALAPHIGNGLRDDANYSTDALNSKKMGVYLCPSDAAEGNAAAGGVEQLLYSGSGDLPNALCSFAFNEGLLGDAAPSTLRLSGWLPKVSNPTTLLMFCDGLPSTGSWCKFTPTAAIQNLQGVYAAQLATFEEDRHKSKFNVVFADSHVRTMEANQGTYTAIYLNN